MGDRANVYITNEYCGQGSNERDLKTGAPTGKVIEDNYSTGLYFYTHWSGFEWPEILRQALKFGSGRWGDDSYLVRVLASRMFKDIEDGDSGGGIGTRMGDNEHTITIVDLNNQRVAFANQGQETDPGAWYGIQSFRDYTAQEIAKYPTSVSVSVVEPNAIESGIDSEDVTVED